MPLAIGCMSTPANVVRGQSPAAPRDNRVQPAGGFYGDTSGPVQQVGFHGWGCNNGCCNDGCQKCPTCGDCSGRCGHCLSGCCSGLGNFRNGPGGAWVPTHQHWFSYEAPRNLQYPAANVPPASIFYPYYTVKGPDDFFKAY